MRCMLLPSGQRRLCVEYTLGSGGSGQECHVAQDADLSSDGGSGKVFLHVLACDPLRGVLVEHIDAVPVALDGVG